MIRLLLKFMTSHTDGKKIATPILRNISRSKDNQKVKFGQLIDHNKRNIFLRKSCRK